MSFLALLWAIWCYLTSFYLCFGMLKLLVHNMTINFWVFASEAMMPLLSCFLHSQEINYLCASCFIIHGVDYLDVRVGCSTLNCLYFCRVIEFEISLFIHAMFIFWYMICCFSFLCVFTSTIFVCWDIGYESHVLWIYK